MNGVYTCNDYEITIINALIYIIAIIDIIDIIIAVIMYHMSPKCILIVSPYRPQVRREHQTGSCRRVISADHWMGQVRHLTGLPTKAINYVSK